MAVGRRLQFLATWMYLRLPQHECSEEEVAKTKVIVFCNLILKAIYHYLCDILLVIQTNTGTIWVGSVNTRRLATLGTTLVADYLNGQYRRNKLTYHSITDLRSNVIYFLVVGPRIGYWYDSINGKPLFSNSIHILYMVGKYFLSYEHF